MRNRIIRQDRYTSRNNERAYEEYKEIQQVFRENINKNWQKLNKRTKIKRRKQEGDRKAEKYGG